MNLKDLTKELLGKSLNKYYQNTGMSSLDSVNERQDLLLEQLFKDTSVDYVEKTFNDGSTKLVASSNNAVEVCNIKGVTKYKVDGVITDTWKEGCEILGVGDYDKSLDKYKIEILSCGKNLCPNSFVPIDIDANTEKEYPSSNSCSTTEFILLNSKKKYILKRYGANNHVVWRIYDKNKKYLGTELPSDYIGLYYAKARIILNNETISDLKIMLTMEDNSLYEPYKEDKTQIFIDKPLMRLSNGVCDEYINGKINRRIGKRDYQTGDENNPDVITDKKVTYYQLETPIIEDVKIDAPLLLKGFEEGHLGINTLISPEATIRYKITNKTFEEIEATKSINESVKKTVEQTYPTLMSMDMSLLDLEMKIQDKLQNRIRVK